jgi:hypothetical protein
LAASRHFRTLPDALAISRNRLEAVIPLLPGSNSGPETMPNAKGRMKELFGVTARCEISFAVATKGMKSKH